VLTRVTVAESKGIESTHRLFRSPASEFVTFADLIWAQHPKHLLKAISSTSPAAKSLGS